MTGITTTPTNADNIISHVSRIYAETRTSKAGKPYHVLVISWILPNGKAYVQNHFITSEQLALIESSVAKEALL